MIIIRLVPFSCSFVIFGILLASPLLAPFQSHIFFPKSHDGRAELRQFIISSLLPFSAVTVISVWTKRTLGRWGGCLLFSASVDKESNELNGDDHRIQPRKRNEDENDEESMWDRINEWMKEWMNRLVINRPAFDEYCLKRDSQLE